MTYRDSMLLIHRCLEQGFSTREAALALDIGDYFAEQDRA